MKGFIEVVLLLIILLLSSELISLNNQLNKQLKLLNIKINKAKAISDINYAIIKSFKYESKYTPIESTLHNQRIIIKNLKTENEISKTIVQSKRIFNWQKFTKLASTENNCLHENLQLSKDVFFDCKELKIKSLTLSAKVACSGSIIIENLLEIDNAAIIAFNDLKIKNNSSQGSLIAFSQTGITEFINNLDCQKLSLIKSDIVSDFSCENKELDQEYWPALRIISSQLP